MRAISAVVNGGNLMQPYLGKEIVNAEGVPKYGYALTIVFDGVSGTENFANWTVTVNGVAVKRELVFQNGSLAFGNPATVISFR